MKEVDNLHGIVQQDTLTNWRRNKATTDGKSSGGWGGGGEGKGGGVLHITEVKKEGTQDNVLNTTVFPGTSAAKEYSFESGTSL